MNQDDRDSQVAPFPTKLVGVAAVLTLAILAWLFWFVYDTYGFVQDNNTNARRIKFRKDFTDGAVLSGRIQGLEYTQHRILLGGEQQFLKWANLLAKLFKVDPAVHVFARRGAVEPFGIQAAIEGCKPWAVNLYGAGHLAFKRLHSLRSSIAATPIPPAVQIEINPLAGPSCSASNWPRVPMILAPVAAKG